MVYSINKIVCMFILFFIFLQAWTFNFVLRAWKNHILNDSNRKMDEFISQPTYISIEVNCHNLISFYRRLRDKNQLHVFKYLGKCSSQPCEELFRRYRSMTTINWTSINMSMAEVCQKTKRINVMCKKEKALSSKRKH